MRAQLVYRKNFFAQYAASEGDIRVRCSRWPALELDWECTTSVFPVQPWFFPMPSRHSYLSCSALAVWRRGNKQEYSAAGPELPDRNCAWTNHPGAEHTSCLRAYIPRRGRVARCLGPDPRGAPVSTAVRVAAIRNCRLSC